MGEQQINIPAVVKVLPKPTEAPASEAPPQAAEPAKPEKKGVRRPRKHLSKITVTVDGKFYYLSMSRLGVTVRARRAPAAKSKTVDPTTLVCWAIGQRTMGF
jgi:hypothetical protein